MTRQSPASSRSFLLVALGFEIGLGLLALAVAWGLGRPLAGAGWPVDRAGLGRALLWGTLGAGVLFLGLIWLDRRPVGPLVGLRELVHTSLVPLFRHVHVAGLAAISAAAGWGEELLFRGLVQDGLADWWRPLDPGIAAWLVASVLFGACHWLSASYAVVTTAIGLMLGAVYWWEGSLLAPMVMHGLYDFLALCYLTGGRRSRPADRTGVGPAGEIPADDGSAVVGPKVDTGPDAEHDR